MTAEGSLTTSIAAGAVTDQYGFPNVAFSATYSVDVGTVAFPLPLIAENPLGSMIYSGSVNNRYISTGTDTDSFTIDLDAGQTITAVVQPAAGLQPTVTLTGPGVTIGPQTASAAGKAVFLQTCASCHCRRLYHYRRRHIKHHRPIYAPDYTQRRPGTRILRRAKRRYSGHGPGYRQFFYCANGIPHSAVR